MDRTCRVSPLKDMALIAMAVNVCQGNSFKELALLLEKTTYGHFLPGESLFVNDPKDYSIWAAKMKEMPLRERSSGSSYVKEQRDAALENECQRLADKFPRLLRDRVRIWINRIALEYLSYGCRLEAFFGVSRYFLMTFLNIGDWKETGRLDEKKVALRLLEDERLTVFQKYQIACVYCLHEHIPRLWKRLTREEVSLITEDLEPYRERIRSNQLLPFEHKNTHILVLLWSYQMEGDQEEKLTESELWIHAVRQATCYGNSAALRLCWERLNEETRQQIVIDMTFLSVKVRGMKWSSNLYDCDSDELQEISFHNMPSAALSKYDFSLRSYYGELVLFFLTQMDEEQKLTFFKTTIQSLKRYNVLECFLDWPLQQELLRTINRLWGFIRGEMYGECMYTLARKCCKNLNKENHIDDYRRLFGLLWETTPKEFKQFVFRRGRRHFHLLYFLLPSSSFPDDDDSLFNRVFSYQSQEDRREMMHSQHGEQLLKKLLKEENLSFLNWLLEECLLKEEIPSFKREFIKSDSGYSSCFDKLADNREKFVQDVLDCCLNANSEKSRFKYHLIHPTLFYRAFCRGTVFYSLFKREFAKVDRMINFCVSSDEVQKQFKADFARYACEKLLEMYESGEDDEISIVGATKWEQMDKILSWSLASDEEIRNIKNYLFRYAKYYHFKIVFDNRKWEEVERYYKWFDLSLVEIKNLKHTIFNPDLILKIQDKLLSAEVLVAPLRWCLTDEETVIRFKKTIEENLSGLKESEAAKERLNYLVSELLCGLRVEENQDETSREGTFVKQIAEKRSVEIEDESNSSYKRFMRVHIQNKE